MANGLVGDVASDMADMAVVADDMIGGLMTGHLNVTWPVVHNKNIESMASLVVFQWAEHSHQAPETKGKKQWLSVVRQYLSD